MVDAMEEEVGCDTDSVVWQIPVAVSFPLDN